MRRRPSPLLRATRALVGLVTIWCLGCSGYEPIVESLAFGTAMRALTDVAVHEGTSGIGAAASNSESGGLNATVDAADEGFDCCGSGCCHLVFIDYVRAGHVQVHTLRQMHELLDELTSVSRAPLIPPPQRIV